MPGAGRGQRVRAERMLVRRADFLFHGALMSERIQRLFESTRLDGRAAFIAYLCGGDPSLDVTRELVPALGAAGVDLVEIGLPFSDPLADGAVNQAASQRALDAGATTRGVFDTIRALRGRTEIPVVLYTYLNPVYSFGYEAFHRAAADAGVDGLLILDLPPDEEDRNAELTEDSGLAHIRLVAPTTPEDRVRRIVAGASGFIYYVSRLGVTGERPDVAEGVGPDVARIKRHTDLPVAVGFGISRPEHVRQVAAHADGVVVGSAIVRTIAGSADSPDLVGRVAEFVRPLAAAVRRDP